MKKTMLTILLASSMAISSSSVIAFAETANEAGADEVKYVSMNVPYTDFYEAYDLTDKAVWDVNGEGLDAVSTATTSKFKGTTGLANGTYNDGTYILGVTIPVAVQAEDYAKLTADTEGNYAFTDLTETPAAYSELTINEDGSYSFSAMQAYTTTGLSVAESASGFTTAGYGDYQIDLEGVTTSGTLTNGTEDTTDDISYGAIYGAILYTDNGKALGMTALENMWFGTRVKNVEIAWSIAEGQGLKRGHGSGDNFYQFTEINGQKLTKVDIITGLGVISIPCDITMTKYYTGEDKNITVAAKDDQTMTVSYPSALEDVQVSVTYKAGRATTTLADKVAPVDGDVALNAALNELETSYTVTVYSSNYAPISTTYTYGTPALDYYKAQLTQKKDEAAALTEKNPALTTLAAHVTEAEELLAKEDATTEDIQALISELDELIAEAEKTIQGTGKVQKFTYWVTVDAIRNANGNIISVEYPEGTTFGDQNAAYAETAMEGIQDQIAAKGSISSVNDIDVVSGATLTSNAIKAAIAAMNGEEFDLTAANGSLVTGKNGELGLADSIKKAENFLKISSLEKDNEGNYITEGKSEAWMTLYDLYTQAVAMNAANAEKENYEEGLEEGLLEAKIDEALVAVKAESGSSDRGGASKAGDTTNLQAVVDNAKALNEADYTADSWKLLQDELSEAESLIATGKANQAALDNQQADLEKALEGLVEAAPAKETEENKTTEAVAATIKASNKTVKAAAKTQTIKLDATVDSKAALSYSSDNSKITVDKNGNVKVAANYVGKATITIKAAAANNYKAAEKKVTVTVTKANNAQSMTVKAAKNVLKVNKKKAQTVKITVKKAVGKVTYKSNKAKVKISTKGKVTIPKNFKGTVKITIKAAGNNLYKAATKTISIKVK